MRHVWVIERRDAIFKDWEFNQAAQSERIANAMIEDWNEAEHRVSVLTEYRLVKYVPETSDGN